MKGLPSVSVGHFEGIGRLSGTLENHRLQIFYYDLSDILRSS